MKNGTITPLEDIIDNIGLEQDEQIKPIDGYEGYYITNYGRVLSVRYYQKTKTNWRWVKPFYDSSGYLQVEMLNHQTGVHRLVAKAFVDGYSDEKNEVNHINEIKTDNRAINLEWITKLDNILYGTRAQRVAEKHCKPVAQYTLDGQLVKVWASASEAERIGGYNRNCIGPCALGKTRNKTHAGYIWKYI